MKECFVITTYCNTPKKVEELKNCINNLKKFNLDILIHAHYPLDLEIQKSVKYYLYDSTNPVIRDGSKVIIRWKWYKTANKLLTITNPDYSYAVINQWVSSIKFLKEKKYDKIHVINYDTFINNYVLSKHQEFLDEHDVVFEYTNLHPRDFHANQISDKKLIFVVFFSIRNSAFLDAFLSELTLEKYLESRDTMLETFLMEVLDKLENKFKNEKFFGLDLYKIKKFYDSEFKLYLGDAVLGTNIKREEHDVYTTVSEANVFHLVKKTVDSQDLYYVFGAINKDYDKFEFLIFEITKPINNLIINIDGDITNVNNITDKYYSLLTKYSKDEIFRIIDEDKFSVIIDNEEVGKDIINAIKYQEIQKKLE